MSVRSEFIDRVAKIHDKYRKEDCNLYLCSLDFADFKLINHSYGFRCGDELLDKTVRFVRRIPECVLCERAAVDQLVIVIVTPKTCTEERMLSAYSFWVEKFLTVQQRNYPVCTLRIWCGIYEIRDRDIASAIDNASLARREAKTTGALMPVMFKESMMEKLLEQQKQELEVGQALKEGRFTFYLQPQADLRTGEIVGAEALARGFHPDGDMISPADFVPILEKNGQILELDYLILEQVCRHIRKRLDAGAPVIQISVNLSRMHVRKAETVERIREIVEKYRIPPELLMFELTENILLHEFLSAKALGSRLRSLGYKTSIDDFGSGYAGIDVWRNLSFDELKLDKSFLTEDPEMKRRNEIIVSGLVWIAQKLHTRVICEGVETKGQCRELLAVGCHRVQGFYFSRPVPAAEFYKTYEELHGHYPLDF